MRPGILETNLSVWGGRVEWDGSRRSEGKMTPAIVDPLPKLARRPQGHHGDREGRVAVQKEPHAPEHRPCLQLVGSNIEDLHPAAFKDPGAQVKAGMGQARRPQDPFIEIPEVGMVDRMPEPRGDQGAVRRKGNGKGKKMKRPHLGDLIDRAIENGRPLSGVRETDKRRHRMVKHRQGEFFVGAFMVLRPQSEGAESGSRIECPDIAGV